jgi:hypothetical protein
MFCYHVITFSFHAPEHAFVCVCYGAEDLCAFRSTIEEALTVKVKHTLGLKKFYLLDLGDLKNSNSRRK